MIRLSNFKSKGMMAVLFDIRGVINVDLVLEDHTANQEYYK